MPGHDLKAVELFQEKAKPVSIQLVTVKDLFQAMDYALMIAEKKDPCQLLMKVDGPGPDNGQKSLAAPSLSDQNFSILAEKAKNKNIELIRKDLRKRMAGIDVTFGQAEMGIAETATSIIQCRGEDNRLSTMISEIHILALAKSKIVKTLYEAEDFLNRIMKNGSNYTSFISGPSRTADIERVTTLGAHGPMELHIALMEE
jgi:L-lactate dehydrogenase complex protein LldG